jgi:GR25 family glycosyltransferase involved in LPS biosynthesis
MPGYRGIYINLDRSVTRRAAMDAQLRKCGVAPRYTRLAAIDGHALPRRTSCAIAPGEEGAFRSHAAAMREASSWNAPVHFLEDDALLSSVTSTVIEQAAAAGLLDRFDILFTDTLVAPDLGMLKVLTQAFSKIDRVPPEQIGLNDLQLIDVSRQNFACLTSYVVSPKAIPKVGSLLQNEIDSGPRLPVDLFLRQCAHAGRLTAGLLAPFVTSFNLDEVRQSTIAAGAAAAKSSVMVMAVLRYIFFAERDLALAKFCLETATAATATPRSEQSGIILKSLEFILSDEFRQF